MKKCEHKHVQQYTEICLDCNKNIYESDEDEDEDEDDLYKIKRNLIDEIVILYIKLDREVKIDDLIKLKNKLTKQLENKKVKHK